jgi:hypothetical protein
LRDAYSDLAVYRPGDRTLRVQSGRGETFTRTTSDPAAKVYPEFTQVTGSANTVIFPEVLMYWNNGSGNNSNGYFRFERFSGDSFFPTQLWGVTGDIPYGGDFNGDGQLDAGLFRNGRWWSLNRMNYPFPTPGIIDWGTAGDKPVPADYDYDGRTDHAIYRPGDGTWWIQRSSDGGASVARFGIATDIPVTGDYDADGRADLTVYRPSEGNWYQFLTTEGFRVVRWGIATDVPVSGDYDGDGRHDVAVFRDGLWYILQSSGGFVVKQWGAAGDIPVTPRYDQ